MLFKHQPWHLPEDSRTATFEFEWNCWTTRQHPYNLVDCGDFIMTVTGGGPHKGRVHNEVEIIALVKGHYSSHEEAWNLIESGIDAELLTDFEFTRDRFLRHDYTRNAPREGWLLAFASFPAMIIDQPRPESLVFRPNGWAERDDDEVNYLYAEATVVEEDTPVWIELLGDDVELPGDVE